MTVRFVRGWWHRVCACVGGVGFLVQGIIQLVEVAFKDMLPKRFQPIRLVAQDLETFIYAPYELQHSSTYVLCSDSRPNLKSLHPSFRKLSTESSSEVNWLVGPEL